MSFKLPKQQDIDEQLEEASIEMLAYDTQFRQYRLRVNPICDEKQWQTLAELAKLAREGYGKAS
ncbi:MULTISPECIES: hypothetical protein [Cupriavidus]